MSHKIAFSTGPKKKFIFRLSFFALSAFLAKRGENQKAVRRIYQE
ncbi:hypothetical protein GCWU000342_00473 [Shuttleworthella satelles DSM 14600]|uniref:Uncharacterized protein n=1 Tax=Shuttleworthella satelles DSM 14600 TaxID=626523 RepID=C4G923_9FIRM|nr:hypothetical protein GCWU000342_00473 [Shuttleworthia satelles DSM 14600]